MFHHTPFLYSSSRAIQLSLRSTAFWGSSLFFPCAPGQWMRYKSRKGLCRASRELSRAARVLSYPWSQGAGYVIGKFYQPYNTGNCWRLLDVIGDYRNGCLPEWNSEHSLGLGGPCFELSTHSPFHYQLRVKGGAEGVRGGAESGRSVGRVGLRVEGVWEGWGWEWEGWGWVWDGWGWEGWS